MKTDLLSPWYGTKPQEDAKKAEAERSQLFADVADTFSTPHGRRVLVHILSHAQLFMIAFTGNSQTYYNTALQDFGNQLLNLVAASDMETYLHVFKQQGAKINSQFHQGEKDK